MLLWSRHIIYLSPQISATSLFLAATSSDYSACSSTLSCWSMLAICSVVSCTLLSLPSKPHRFDCLCAISDTSRNSCGLWSWGPSYSPCLLLEFLCLSDSSTSLVTIAKTLAMEFLDMSYVKVGSTAAKLDLNRMF